MIDVAERFYSPLYLAATALFLAAAVCGAHIVQDVLIGVLTLGVVLFGLPHGAIDPLVAKKAMGGHPFYSWQAFSLIYASTALLYGLLWWLCPTAILATFLGMSALHFGTDWDRRGNAWTRLAYGAAVVTLPLLFHCREVAAIYGLLGASGTERFVSVSRVVALIGFPIAMLAALAQWRQRKADLLEFGGILASALVLPPLLFFACYFCLLHSPRHLLATARRMDLRSGGELVRTVAPAVAASVAAGAALWGWLPAGPGEERILRVVFIGLAALTLPHMALAALVRRASVPYAPPLIPAQAGREIL